MKGYAEVVRAQLRRPVFLRFCPAPVLTMIFILLNLSYSAAQSPTSKPGDWRDDLRVLSTNLPALHPNLFFQLPRSTFDNEVAQLNSDIPSLSDTQIIIRMARIVAMVGDAHTSLSVGYSSVPFHTLPLRLQWFSDGIFVTATSPEYRAALGCKLIKVGQTDIGRVYEEVGKLISHENEPWQQCVSQATLLVPEVLHALGFLPDEEKARFVFQSDAGENLTLDLQPILMAQAVNWITPFDGPNKTTRPLYLKNWLSGFSYWGEYLSDSSTLYLKYDKCQSDAGLPFQYLANEILGFIPSGAVRHVVVDLRNNSGGNSSVIYPLIDGLQREAALGLINPSTDLSVVIGRQTFSSGMLNALDLKSIGAKLVGEPTGGKPNSYGEVQNFMLPKSGLIVSYSTKYFHLTTGDPPSVMPDLAAATSSRDYFQGRDPALDSILEGAPTTSSIAGFVLYQNGGVSQATASQNPSTAVGYGTLDSQIFAPAPAGLAILTARKNEISVSEATVPAAPASSGGRLYVELQGPVKTGIAFANPNDAPATISYYFTDSTGKNSKQGSSLLAARGQMARYLDQEPFNGDASFVGTFTWTSTVPLGSTALREVFSEGSELLTTLPIAGLVARSSETQVLAHFADGGGWATQVVLVNPTDNPLKGSLQFVGQGSAGQIAQPAEVTVNGTIASSFSYDLPARGVQRFSTEGNQSQTQAGSVWIVPAGDSSAPSALGIFTFSTGGRIISTAGVPALAPRSTFRIYAEASGDFRGSDFGSTMTGVAISNFADATVAVNLTLRYLSGSAAKSASLSIPAHGQTAVFLNQVPGFDQVQTPFQGSLEISSPWGNIAVTGLRARYNEKGDFLIAATPPIDDSDQSRSRLFST